MTQNDETMNEFWAKIVDTYLGTFFLQHKQAASMVTNDTLAINETKTIKKTPFSIIASDIQAINPCVLWLILDLTILLVDCVTLLREPSVHTFQLGPKQLANTTFAA